MTDDAKRGAVHRGKTETFRAAHFIDQADPEVTETYVYSMIKTLWGPMYVLIPDMDDDGIMNSIGPISEKLGFTTCLKQLESLFSILETPGIKDPFLIRVRRLLAEFLLNIQEISPERAEPWLVGHQTKHEGANAMNTPSLLPLAGTHPLTPLTDEEIANLDLEARARRIDQDLKTRFGENVMAADDDALIASLIMELGDRGAATSIGQMLTVLPTITQLMTNDLVWQEHYTRLLGLVLTATAQKICSNCRAFIPMNARFCSACSTKQPEPLAGGARPSLIQALANNVMQQPGGQAVPPTATAQAVPPQPTSPQGQPSPATAAPAPARAGSLPPMPALPPRAAPLPNSTIIGVAPAAAPFNPHQVGGNGTPLPVAAAPAPLPAPYAPRPTTPRPKWAIPLACFMGTLAIACLVAIWWNWFLILDAVGWY